MYKINFLFNILFCFVSIFIFILSPSVYSYSYCLMILLVFIFFNVCFFSTGVKKEGLSFEFIFMISFFMTNFAYPVFYFNSNPNVSLFSYGFNYSIISKATAVALVAYSFYLLGVSSYSPNNVGDISEKFKLRYADIMIFFILSVVTFLLFFIFGGIDNLRDVYNGSGAQLATVNSYSYFFMIFQMTTLILSMFVFQIKNNFIFKSLIFLFISIVLLLLLSTGSRATAIAIVLVLIFSYSRNVKRIPLMVASFWVLLSANFLYLVMLIRSSGQGVESAFGELSSSSSYFDSFLDLIINNRNLYVLIDFVDSNGYVYFFNNFYNSISFLPFNSKVISLFNVPSFIQRGELPTFLEFGNNSSFGMGTNMVGEAYLSFGLMGVIITFFCFGFIVKYVKRKSFLNIYYYILFMLLISMSIMFARAASMPDLRYFIWPIILFFVIVKFNKLLSKTSKSES